MIVSFLRQFVYVGPPKTASTSLHEWLSQPALCERVWSSKSGDQHVSQPPPEAIPFFTFASIRNPYSRAVSLWRHGLASGAKENPCVPRLEFAEFVARLPVATQFYGAPQTAWLGAIRLDAIVPIEQIESILELPPIAPWRDMLAPLRRLNASQHDAWQSYYDARLADDVFQHFQDDFRTFGYARKFS